MGTNALGDAIKTAIDALTGVDKQDREKLMRAMGNAIEDWTGFAATRTAGDSGTGAIKYNGLTPVAGQMDGSTTDPSATTRLNYNGAFWATELHSVSSRKVKENICRFTESALAILKSVVIDEYTLKEDPVKCKRVGFVAEEVPSVLSGRYRDSMDISNTLGLLIRAVQELADRLEPRDVV